MSVSPSRIYESLHRENITRIVQIRPGQSADPLVARLITIDIHEQGRVPYVALSHRWDYNNEGHSIDLLEGKLSISPSIDSALRQIRSSTPTACLWIDSICINQGDDDEKSIQVAMMRDIYQSAEHVVVWLPCDSHDLAREVGVAVDNFYSFLSSKAFEMDGKTLDDHLQPEMVLGRIDPSEFSLNDVVDWKPLSWLYGQEWFRRKWVIQEVTCHDNVSIQVADQVVSWKKTGLISHWLMMHHAYVLEIPPTMPLLGVVSMGNTLRQRGRFPGNKLQRWLAVLTQSITFETTDPRDAILALRGSQWLDWGVDAGTRDWTPNYKMSAEEVFRMVTIKYIEQSSTIDMLGLVNHGKEFTKSGLPSWVPRFNLRRAPVSYTISEPTGDINAWPNSVAGTTVVDGTPNLVLRGVEVDGIAMVLPSYGKLAVALFFLIIWAQQESYLDRYGGREGWMTAFAVTLAIGNHHSRITTGADLEELTTDCTSFLFSAIQTLAGGMTSDSQQRAATILKELYFHSLFGNAQRFESILSRQGDPNQRRFFVTENGRFGLGVDAMREGDRVCFAQGGKSAYYLRRVSDSEQYIFLGEAYVRGLMHGELLQCIKDEQLEVKDYHLC